jgi:hypothetical protein
MVRFIPPYMVCLYAVRNTTKQSVSISEILRLCSGQRLWQILNFMEISLDSQQCAE